MPAGVSAVPDPPWDSYSSFRRFVLAECLRIGRPAPDDHALAADYIERRGIIARAQAVDQAATEVAAWELGRHHRRGGVVAR